MTAEGRWTLAILLYLAAQVALRLAIGPALELDEAEALFFSRELAWGYGPQPPLYFWLQWGLFQALGPSILALAALKAALLGGAAIALLRLLRTDAPGAAGPAVLSLALLPQVAWEAQRALTHSVLALACAVLAAAALVRALRSGRALDHALLGLAIGLGMLSKLNFAVWAAGLLAAAALLPPWRARLRMGQLLLSGCVVALVVAGPVAWMLRNPGLATASAGKLALDPAGASARLAGLAAWVEATGGVLALAAVVLGGFAVATRGAAPLPPVARLLLVASLAGLALVLAGLLAAGATDLRERWLLPIAWALPPVVVVALWPRLGRRGRRALTGLCAALWLIAMAALPYASLRDPGYRGARFAPLAQAVRGLGAPGLPVAATSTWVAGNLALADPALDPGLWSPGTPGPMILVGAPAEVAEALAAAGTPGVAAARVAVGDGARFETVAVLRE